MQQQRPVFDRMLAYTFPLWRSPGENGPSPRCHGEIRFRESARVSVLYNTEPELVATDATGCWNIMNITPLETSDSEKLRASGGHAWRSWLRHCATSRMVASSIPDGDIGIFHWSNPSGRNMTPGSTQPLTEMSTRNISWGVKVAGA
jgi:hypothetical protein